MLKRRGLISADSGTKELKIQRLRNNDKIERQRGYGGGVLYGQLLAYEWMLQSDQEVLSQKNSLHYDSFSQARLTRELDERGLSQSGSTKALVSRLRANDRTTLKAHTKD